MQEQEQCILDQQPLKVLSLFPKRQISHFKLNQVIYAKLYDNLTCTICRQIFINPVYLKCSHRFCKDCIERYIRSNTKKSCPNCRGGLTTKRDLRSDYSLESFISFAFGDAKKLTRDLQELDKVQLQKNKLIELKRIESMMQIRQRPTSEVTEDNFLINISGIKRIKSNDGQQIRRKKKEKSEKKINIDKQIKSSQATKNTKKIEQQSQNNTQTPKIQINKKQSRKKKKDVIIIQIQSNSNQLVNPAAFSNLQQTMNVQISSKAQCISIDLIADNNENQNNQPYNPSKQYVQANYNIAQSPLSKDLINNVASQISIGYHKQKYTVSPQVQAAKKILIEQFGQNYLNNIIQLSQFLIFINIELRKHPDHPFTPQLEQTQLKLTAKSPVNIASCLIANALNINKESIRLYVREVDGSFIEIQNEIKLQQLNQKYWKIKNQYQLIDVQQILETDPDESFAFKTYQIKKIKTKPKPLIYYAVEYSKIIL